MPYSLIETGDVGMADLKEPFLKVSELFYDTIQGEGVHIGHPAAFLRLQGCTLNCEWCDTTHIWKYGAGYSFENLLDMIEMETTRTRSMLNRLRAGQHLVVTGGSPLLQQSALISFFEAFYDRFFFIPFIEIENECVKFVSAHLDGYVSCWNNSPKLSNSGIIHEKRYKSNIIYKTAQLKNSWFKFVLNDARDWNEIYADFLAPGLIDISQVILMPMGETERELARNRRLVAELAVAYGVRYSTREHIVLWGTRPGV